MELRKFITETLKDIIGGIKDAQNEVEHGVIVPAVDESTFPKVETGFTSYQQIEFEVSVVASEKEGSEAKLNVVAAIIGGGIKGENSNSSGHSAKLTFKVPVKLPKGE